MIDKTAFIHPTAIVEEGAVIGANAHIGPFLYCPALMSKSVKVPY